MKAQLFLLLSFLITSPVIAQSNGPIAHPGLEEMLERLKESADQLSTTNASVNRQNAQMRRDISQLQLKLGQLKAEEVSLTEAAFKLQNKDEGKAKQIAALQKELFNLDEKLDIAQGNIKKASDELLKVSQEEKNIDEQLNQIAQASLDTIGSPQEDEVSASRRKEKINLLRMIDKSKERQLQLNKQLYELKPAGPQTDVIQFTSQREALLAQIELAKKRLAQIPTPEVDMQHIDPQDAQLLSSQMTSLEKNYDELRDLWEKMQSKAQALKMSTDQRVEKDKLEKSLGDLNREAGNLKAQLHDLREQMVELDKRKTRLQDLLAGEKQK